MLRRSLTFLRLVGLALALCTGSGRASTMVPDAPVPMMSRSIDLRMQSIRGRGMAIYEGTAASGAATLAAVRQLRTDGGMSFAQLAGRLVLLCFGGVAAEALFRRWTAAWRQRIVDHSLATARQRLSIQAQRLLFSQGVILSFAAGSGLAYLLIMVPGSVGLFGIQLLVGFIALRTVLSVGRFVLAPGGPRFRLVALPTRSAVRLYCWYAVVATVLMIGLEWAALIQIARAQTETAAAIEALTLLVAALTVTAAVMLFARFDRGGRARPLRPALVAFAPAPLLAWLLAQAGLPEAARILLAVGLTPGLSLVLGDAARTVAFGPCQSGRLTHEERTVARAARNAAAITAVVFVIAAMQSWKGDARFAASFGLLGTLAILLCADLVWQVTRGLIDHRLAQEGDGTMRPDRLVTVLPALRRAVFFSILVVAILSAASAFGLQIGPLLAGAGVVGLSIGFGAQALVRDVISGFFFLLDDAFRIGETIASGSLQGQVEAFSLRSVRLRDDDGHMHTVAFGELKAVTNFSRDWAGMEIPIFIAHGVPFDAVAAVIIRAIDEVAADEDLAATFQSAPRFAGVTALSETSLKLSILIKTKPGRQFALRSELLRRILAGMAGAGLPIGVDASTSRNSRPAGSTTRSREPTPVHAE